MFKPGYKVICIAKTEGQKIQIGDVYTIKDIMKSSGHPDSYVFHELKFQHSYFVTKFISYKSKEFNQELEKIVSEGNEVVNGS